MNKDLIINCRATHSDIALLEDGNLVELHQEKGDQKFTVGDVFLGKVKKILPSLNAVFVNIGHERDAFLHYSDLGPQVKSVLAIANPSDLGHQITDISAANLEDDIIKTGSVKDVLQKGQNLLVQIIKEPISTKGHRLTTRINLTGRYIVLLPFANSVNVSRKIKSNDERIRLRKAVEKQKEKDKRKKK